MTFALPDLDRVADLVREVARTAVMPYFRAPEKVDIRQKTGPNDLVTAADEAAERALTAALTALEPGSTVVGEEAVSVDAALLERLRGDAPVWIIDPVDGTINFANGKPAFAVIVAYARGGKTLAGWIHDPVDGRMAVAATGQGAWVDGRRATVAAAVPVSAMVGALSTHYCDPALGRQLSERGSGVGRVQSLASAAQEYLRLLQGDAHFSLYHRLMPWDHAAGVLMHGEAGGYSALADGSPYEPTVVGGTLINAPDAASWRALRDHLMG